MTRKQILILILIFLFLSIGLILLLKSFIRKDIVITPALNSAYEQITNAPAPSPIPSIEISSSLSPSPSPCEEIPTTTVYATTTIQTGRRTKTFDIYPNVEEETLNHHIGHLPSSVNPGNAGLCVLMGHRDKELKILKYTKVDDIYTIQKNGTDYRYRVIAIEIQDNASPLTFHVTDMPSLAIVTCYPFDFLGAAPQRIIVYCMLLK